MEEYNFDAVIQRFNKKERKAKRKIAALKATLAIVMLEINKRHKKLQELKLRKTANPSTTSGNGVETRVQNSKRSSHKGNVTLILPKEMWTHAFNNLGDGVDLLNANNTCRLFHDILNQKKTTWLFDKIIPILANNLELDDLLICREVCKKWKMEVDKLIEDQSISQPYLDASFKPRSYLQSPKHDYFTDFFQWTNFSERDDFNEVDDDVYELDDSFQEKLENIFNSNNPFKIKLIDITTTRNRYRQYRNDDNAVFWDGIKLLLESFGKNISYLCLSEKNRILKPKKNSSSRDLVTLEILNFVPNLRSLQITESHQRRYKKSKMIDLTELPELPKLHRLDLDVTENPLLTSSLCSKYSKQLVYLCVNDTISFLIASKFDWPNLTELEIGTIEMELINSRNLEAFKNLRKLRLKIKYEDKEKECLEGIIKIVNGFAKVAPNFHFLGLSFKTAIKVKEILSLPTCLYATSNLQALEVKLKYDWGNKNTHFAFLLRFPFIKHLIIRCREPWRYESEGEIVEVYNYATKGISIVWSNIWELFHELQVFSVNGKNYYLRKRSYNKEGYLIYNQIVEF